MRSDSATCFAARRSGTRSVFTLRSGRVGAGAAVGERVSRLQLVSRRGTVDAVHSGRFFMWNRQMRHRHHRLAAGTFECGPGDCEIGSPGGRWEVIPRGSLRGKMALASACLSQLQLA
jgi:hypothetical protein